MIAAIVIGALVGLAVGGVVIWWIAQTFWWSFQTIRAERKIRRQNRG